MKALFVVNPRSGARRRINVAEALRESCRRTPHRVIDCPAVGELARMVEEAKAQHFDVVFAVGGDGTVHEIAKHLIGRQDLALGIVPTGSGNGFARHLGLDFDIASALALCEAGSVVTIDTAEVNCSPFLGVMGLGLDAVIAHRFAGSDIRGLRTYVVEGLKAYFSFVPEEYEVSVDDRKTMARAALIAVANSNQYGNNARIAPLASVQDGQLDVVIVEKLPLVGAPILLTRLFNGTLHKSRRVRFLQGRAVTIRRAAAGPAHLDGEPVTLEETLNVTVRPSSLRVLLPRTPARI
jgi:YegS/Rv2252/BmrU family lipid kinase